MTRVEEIAALDVLRRCQIFIAPVAGKIPNGGLCPGCRAGCWDEEDEDGNYGNHRAACPVRALAEDVAAVITALETEPPK